MPYAQHCALSSCKMTYFIPGLFFILFSNFWLFMVVGVLGLGSCVGFLWWRFQLMGFGAFGVESYGCCGVGAVYVNIEE